LARRKSGHDTTAAARISIFQAEVDVISTGILLESIIRQTKSTFAE